MCVRELKAGPSDTVLIHAAAGALGTFTAQLALTWEASTVIGTAGVRVGHRRARLGASGCHADRRFFQQARRKLRVTRPRW